MLKYLQTFEKFKEPVDIRQTIKNLKKVSAENKEIALTLLRKNSLNGAYMTRAKSGVISVLQLHPDLLKKCKEKGYPTGFSMGIDKNGFFIHTHRARSKSHQKVTDITAKEIKFIDSTG